LGEKGERKLFVNMSSGVALLISVIASIMALFIAAPFHEFAHAFAAKREGDYTAVAQKRYTLAPLAHFDIFGFICIFLFGFGWAKPVPVDSRNFKRGRKSQFMVAIAGIVANLILGIAFLFIFMLLLRFAPQVYQIDFFGPLLFEFLDISISLNFMLAFFNLLPIYPLDGYRIIDSFCRFDNKFLEFMRRYSTIIYILILITGVYSVLYSYTMGYAISWLVQIFSNILGL